MKENITLLMYSHSSYSDVWNPFFKQAEKYMPDYKKVLFSDDDLNKTPKDWSFIQYKDEDSYSDRMYKCLENIQTELCFLHHEDMFLYDSPDHDLLNKYQDIVLNTDIDFIRLLRSTDAPSFNYKNNHTLYPVPNHSMYFFSVQPTICKTKSLLEIYKNTKVSHIREFEPKVQKVCRDLGIKGLFHYDSEPKIGDHHYDSKVYPYIATAIVKGKWNIVGYPEQLSRILLENNIDVNIRGKI
mgnify:FL=1|tara:strand:+ start:861 stop:1583 length:723 start_codon:yes stop_codon:yes gene_type:complete